MVKEWCLAGSGGIQRKCIKNNRQLLVGDMRAKWHDQEIMETYPWEASNIFYTIFLPFYDHLNLHGTGNQKGSAAEAIC